jgi:hypothetical protein
VFYLADELYVFFVYKECLLCKVIKEPQNIVSPTQWQAYAKSTQDAPIHFVDGNKETLKDIILEEKYEKSTNNKVVIIPQHFAAVTMGSGKVRIFYKTDDELNRSAVFIEGIWFPEVNGKTLDGEL